MRKQALLGVLTVALLYLTPTPYASAQSTDARLGGTVADATGALIPGVSVTARNVGTGIVNESITNETGSYQFPALQTGTYEVTAELPGFQTQRFTGVQLGGGEQARLNFTLTVADVATTVEVSALAGGALVTTSASVQSVLPDLAVRDLPTGDRNVMELLRGIAGAGPTEGQIDGNFAGGRISATNVTRDGFSVSAGRYNQGTFSTTYTSSDLVEEVRVTTGTVDAEASRGSGQVAMVTRSGTNDFRGSIFWNNQNSALDAATWANNFNGTVADWENRNQFGGRLGGPIIRDKTFFFFLIDEQRHVSKADFVGTVLTPQARQGLFRFWPGVNNQNVLQNNPSVDRDGNPVTPTGATGPLQTINLFALDPNRTGFDPSGYISNTVLPRMPLPNDYTVGDGLNTAGIRFTRRVSGISAADGQAYDQNNRDQINVRLDHYFNPDNKFSFVYTWERGLDHTGQAGLEAWPGGYQGANHKEPQIWTTTLVSTLSPNLVNEARFGYRGHKIQSWAPWYVGREDDDLSTTTAEAQEAFALLPQSNGLPMQVITPSFTAGYLNWTAGFGSTRGSISPLWTYGDTVSWTRGTHSIRTGFEFRRDRTDGWNDNNFTPYVQLGAGFFESPITTASVAGLTTNNATAARNLIYSLSGTIDFVRQGFDLRSTDEPLRFMGFQDGATVKRRDWRANEFNAFFKDDWKVTQNLTLNLGLAWEWYGVPYEGRGLAARPVNGFQGLCGIGCGEVTRVELVGKNSPNPGQQIFNDDWNNFGPSVGFSYSLPWFDRSTVLRGGYGVTYTGAQIKGAMGAGGLDAGAGTLPGAAGITGGNGLTFFNPDPGTVWNLANISLPFEPSFEPLSAVPLTDPRTLTMNMYNPDRPVPYVQNFNLSLSHELAPNWVVDLAYVGSKGTKLYGLDELNYQKIFENGFMEAFNITRAGGDAPLFDQMLNGLTFPLTGPTGTGTVGVNISGSAALRRWTPTRTNIANGAAGAVASLLTTTEQITGVPGGLIRNSGLPEDFMVFNPQFLNVGANGNLTNSTYHSMQLQLTKRFSHGFTNQSSYTWSKTLGLSGGEGGVGARDPRNRDLDKQLLGFHRAHVITSNGTWELPFGPNRALLNVAPTWVHRIVERWQFGALMRWSSGAPLSFTATGSSIWNGGGNTPNVFGALPEGEIVFRTDGRLPTYFDGLTQGPDPERLNVTNTNTLRSTNNRLAVFDASGNLLLGNPAPGEVGNMGFGVLEAPSRFELDMNLVKRVSIDERREFELRIDATNILNHPNFGGPNMDINSNNFGLISAPTDGNRRFTIGARLNF